MIEELGKALAGGWSMDRCSQRVKVEMWLENGPVDLFEPHVSNPC
jgi:hypothetical protein